MTRLQALPNGVREIIFQRFISLKPPSTCSFLQPTKVRQFNLI